jgi:hypothetical protein
VLLDQALHQLQRHHGALTLRFVQADAGWRQTIKDSSKDSGKDSGAAPPLTWISLAARGREDQVAALASMSRDLQASLHLTEGPLIRAAFFDCGTPQASRLLLMIHHLVVDGVSWRILLEDLQTAYGQLSRGEPVRLAPRTASYQEWAEHLVTHAQSPAQVDEARYWLAQLPTQVAPLPLDYPAGRGANTVDSAATVSVALTVDETHALVQQQVWTPRVRLAGSQRSIPCSSNLKGAVRHSGHPLSRR